MNESYTTKFYKKELLINAGVKYAESVSYEEPLFTYPLKYAFGKVAVIEAPLYYYRYMSTELKKILPLYLSNIYLNDSSLVNERKLLECIDALDNMPDDEALIEINKIITELQ